MADTDDNSATVAPFPTAETTVDEPSTDPEQNWDPTTAEPGSAMARWKALEQARSEAQQEFETQIEPFKAHFEATVGPIDDQLEAIEQWFLAHAAETNTDSFDSEAGRVTVATRQTPKITDAESFFAWAASSNNVGLLQKRISVTQFREFAKSNPEQTPPGVTIEAAQSIKFKSAD